MKMDVIKIKEAFNVLMRLGVTEVSLPYKEWNDLEDQLQRYHEDGGSFTYQKRFINMNMDPVEWISLFGVKIVHEGI
jgi:hypothetical protein